MGNREHASDEYQLLKDVLQEQSPLESPEDQTVRNNMIDAVVNGNGMQTVFTETPISEGTDRFLCHIVCTELTAAQAATDQSLLVRTDRPAFLASLCGRLTPYEQQLCQTRLAHMQATRKPEHQWSIDVLLRAFNGEGYRSIGRDFGRTHIQLKSKMKDLYGDWYGKNADHMRDITQRFVRHFPAFHSSWVEGISRCLPYIDGELMQLAPRMHERDFMYLAESIMSVPAIQALAILMSFNVSRIDSFPKHHPLSEIPSSQRAGWCTQYDRRHPELRGAYHVRAVTPPVSPPRQPMYENSDEAMKMIIAALGAVGEPLPREAIVKCAQDIEVGVYAKKLLEEGRTASDLEELVSAGETATIALLASNVKWAKAKARAYKHAYQSSRDVEDLVIPAMQGLLRAVRKYDYTKDISLIKYADAWTNNFLERDVFRNDWGMGSTRASELRAMENRIWQLHIELDRTPTPHDLANAGISWKRLQELRQRRKQAASSDITDKVSYHSAKPVRVALSLGVKEMLEHALHSSPEQLGLVIMYCEGSLTINEISEILGVPRPALNAQFMTAISTLRESMDEAELRRLLRPSE